MEPFKTLKFEPALVAAFISSVLAMVVAFGGHLSDIQIAALLGTFNTGAAIFVRRQTVTKAALEKVSDEIDQAVADATTT